MTHLIADKEKNSASYKENRLESLSEEKIVKIKKFCKEYIAKLQRKLEKSGKIEKRKSRGSSSSKANGHKHDATPSTAVVTPNSGDGEAIEMTVEEAMDMDPDDQVDYNDEYMDETGNTDDGDDEKTKSSPTSAVGLMPPTSINERPSGQCRTDQEYHIPSNGWGPHSRNSDWPESVSVSRVKPDWD